MSNLISMGSDRSIKGVQNLLEDYLGVRQEDFVLFCFQNGYQTPAAWVLMGLSLVGCQHKSYVFSHRDDQQFEADVRKVLPKTATSKGRKIVLVAEGSTLSFTIPLKRLALENFEILRLMNFGEDLFELGLLTPKDQLKMINSGLLHQLMGASHIRITSPLGTDLSVSLANDLYQWVSNHGTPDVGELMVLPAGEINTYPKNISGVFVAEGALHSNVPIPFDVRLNNNPITFEIEANEVKSWQCKCESVMKFLDFVFSRPFGRMVGELGIGTNIGIDRFTEFNSHINERHPGIHLGFGEHTQPGKVAYQAECHVDAISQSGTIYLPDMVNPIDVMRLLPSQLPHPSGTRCEDIEHVPS